MKVVRFFKILSALVFIVGFFLIGNSIVGTVRFSVTDMTIEFPLSYFFVCVLAFSAILIFVNTIWRMIWSIPEKYQRFLARKRQIKAENLIIDAFSSLAAEQPEEAQNAAMLADHLMPNNAMVLLLEGFSAYILNETEKTVSIFNKMKKEQRLEFLGFFGLILESKKQREYLKIREYLEKALKNRHDSPWVQRQLLENDLRLIQEGFKSNAEKGIYSKLLSREDLSKHLSLQHFLLGKKFLNHHDSDGAKESFKKALLEDSSNLAAAIELVQLIKNSDSKIYKLLIKTAKITPHPLLLNGLLNIGSFQSSTLAYHELSEQLPQDNFETSLFLSQLAFKAQLLEIAKHFAEKAFSYHPTIRSRSNLLSIHTFLNVENSSYSFVAIKEDFGWCCKECCRIFTQFYVFCPKCQSVNSVTYGIVEENHVQLTKNLDVLLTGS